MKTTRAYHWGLALVLAVGLVLVFGAWDRIKPPAARATAGTTTLTGLKTGIPGFDFTRMGHNGVALPRQDAAWQNTGSEADGTQWDCLRDNVSGLWWEAKTNAPADDAKQMRHVDHTYSWSGTGLLGRATSAQPFGARCTGMPDAAPCTTQAYVDAINAAGLCGFKDWRLPTVAELKPLTSINKGGATIDVAQFPNTAPVGYWTASSYPHRDNYVWYVFFAGAGDAFGDASTANYAVRVVRTGG